MNKCKATNETTHKKRRKKPLKNRPNFQLTLDMKTKLVVQDRLGFVNV